MSAAYSKSTSVSLARSERLSWNKEMKKEGKFPLLFHFCILNIGKIRFSGLSGNVISKPSAVRENFRVAEPFGYLIGRQ